MSDSSSTVTVYELIGHLQRLIATGQISGNDVVGVMFATTTALDDIGPHVEVVRHMGPDWHNPIVGQVKDFVPGQTGDLGNIEMQVPRFRFVGSTCLTFEPVTP
jgi:hypothetical protein